MTQPDSADPSHTDPSASDSTHGELASRYQPAEVEGTVRDKWIAANAFHAEPNPEDAENGNTFAIVIPPPNVTAALHMGHALNNTLQDILTRYHRMLGDNTLWMPGTDHAGIATQTVVDKRLKEQGEPALVDYKKLELEGQDGRSQFIEKVEAWKDEYEERITNQLKEMGCSCDWDRQRFTMDDQCAAAVREAFFQLFKDGLIYRGKRLVNWDPVSQTALADDEVENQDIDGHFYYMQYPIVDDAGNPTGDTVTVATTRPETMLGDTAVAVNPNDPERAKYIGQFVKLPIVGRVIPVLGDDYVVKPDPDSSDEKAKFASGFLKVTPAHDTNDWEIGLRHDLPVINIMAPDGSISKEHGWDDYDETSHDSFCDELIGMDRYEARKAIVSWFRDNDLLDEVRPYTHSVGHSYRSHVPVEPYLSDQWYVKVTDDKLAGAALRAMEIEQRSESDGCVWKEGDSFESDDYKSSSPQAEDGLRFYPPRYAKVFQSWHENIRDWCISRQLWWGHRIPVWSKRVTTTCTKEEWDATFHWSDVDEMDSADSEFARQIVDTTTGIVVELPDNDIEAIDRYFGKELDIYICKRSESTNKEFVSHLEQLGFAQDPDVLDTWFSSGIWPMSTMGWPNNTAELNTWNPSNLLCTAREIITLWVSRMVMFNVYFRDCLPFTDVFIHAMIQDGHGQKMSKSLGNGVDPLDIIHTHGSDAMRFTLASMTTNTQDVRMPVEMICPHTQETFTPKYIKTHAGHMVAAPTQKCPSDKKNKITSSYGVASGKAVPTDDAPLARNTSEKFDFGRNFANKLWNAVRFALSNLAEADQSQTNANETSDPTLIDRWILTRAADTIAVTDRALNNYEFKPYADGLYDFIWRDFCDWYIEAIKPTIQTNPQQQRVLTTVIDVILRLLHPAMPFITETLFEHLNKIAPDRGVPGLNIPASKLLIHAPWPTADDGIRDDSAANELARLQQIISAAREVRTTYKIPPRQKVDCSIKVTGDDASLLQAHASLLEPLANLTVQSIGADISRPDDAAVALIGDCEIYLHGLIDADEEKKRVEKAIAEKEKSINALKGRLSNEKYVSKAPEKLVQESRDQLATFEKELETLQQQLTEL